MNLILSLSRLLVYFKAIPLSLIFFIGFLVDDTTPIATFIYGFAKSTFFALSGVTVKFANTISTLFVTKYSTLFAASNNSFEGCKELKLSEAKSIVSCPSGDYEVTFSLNRDKRDLIEAPSIVKIGEAPQKVIQYLTK